MRDIGFYFLIIYFADKCGFTKTYEWDMWNDLEICGTDCGESGNETEIGIGSGSATAATLL